MLKKNIFLIRLRLVSVAEKYMLSFMFLLNTFQLISLAAKPSVPIVLYLKSLLQIYVAKCTIAHCAITHTHIHRHRIRTKHLNITFLYHLFLFFFFIHSFHLVRSSYTFGFFACSKCFFFL